MAARFRFEDLEIWKLAVEIADRLFDIADVLEQKKLFRFVDQIRGVAMSMTNNIAEVSGAATNRGFCRHLGISRESVFEAANITIILYRRAHIDEKTKNALLDDLDHLGRMITNFKRSLK